MLYLFYAGAEDNLHSFNAGCCIFFTQVKNNLDLNYAGLPE
ncbi:hypothetical protein [Kaistella carnis]|nr:hypothetical protein [Kaistella carnis]